MKIQNQLYQISNAHTHTHISLPVIFKFWYLKPSILFSLFEMLRWFRMNQLLEKIYACNKSTTQTLEPPNNYKPENNNNKKYGRLLFSYLS